MVKTGPQFGSSVSQTGFQERSWKKYTTVLKYLEKFEISPPKYDRKFVAQLEILE
jgi:hypothetical protein